MDFLLGYMDDTQRNTTYMNRFFTFTTLKVTLHRTCTYNDQVFTLVVALLKVCRPCKVIYMHIKLFS